LSMICTVEIEEEVKPALVANWIVILVTGD
jgi:hypothetical protein